MSVYHEWFMSGASKITVENPAKTVQKASNSFLATVVEAQAPSFVLAFDVAPEPTPETITEDNLSPLPPMRIRSTRPALPRHLWLSGLPAAEALAHHRRLVGDYFCSCAPDADGWFVRCDLVNYEVTP